MRYSIIIINISGFKTTVLSCFVQSRQNKMLILPWRYNNRLAWFQVIHHDGMKLGRSKEEFLQINGPLVATATHVMVLLTDAATGSPFVFHEVLFADWLGKKLVTVMFKNVWSDLRVSLKAVLGNSFILLEFLIRFNLGVP